MKIVAVDIHDYVFRFVGGAYALSNGRVVEEQHALSENWSIH